LLVAAAFAFLAAPGTRQEGELVELDRKVLVELTAVRETPRVVFHWRPGSIDEKALAQDVEANVAALASLEKTLAMRYRGRVHVFLYADGAELKRLTGSGAVAFSTGTVSVHQPHGFRGVHEFVHIYAMQFDRGPDTAGPDLFTTEGLATWLAESDEGVSIHAWAAAYSRFGKLPAIPDLRSTFPQGAGSRVHPYHVAGSFVGFLVERFGIAKVKRWYVDSCEAHQYFGKGLTQLVREWNEFLAGFALDAKDEGHVLKKLGFGVEPMPDAWASAKSTPIFDGRSLAGLAPEDASKWSVKDGVLIGKNDEPWTHLATEKSFGQTVGVRAKLRLASGNAIKLRVNGTKEAILATWASYVSSGEDYDGNGHTKIPVGQWVELVVVDEMGRARVYLDGKSVFDMDGAWADAGAGSLALGVEKGVVEVREWVSFDPGEPMPAAWVSAKTTPLFDGKSLTGLTPEDPSKWSVRDGVLIGKNDAPWTFLATEKSFEKTIGVRARLRLASGDALCLRVNGKKAAILATWSSYVSSGEDWAGNAGTKIAVGQWVDLVVVNDGGRARVYLDGKNLFDMGGAWADAGAGSLAVGVEKGVVELKEWVSFAPR
jgi:hypothetical protein